MAKKKTKVERESTNSKTNNKRMKAEFERKHRELQDQVQAERDYLNSGAPFYPNTMFPINLLCLTHLPLQNFRRENSNRKTSRKIQRIYWNKRPIAAF